MTVQVGQSLDASFVTLVDWVLSWWVAGQDPGLTMIGRQVDTIRPVSRWLAFSVLAIVVAIAGLQVALKRRGEPLADALVGGVRVLLALSAGWLLMASAWAMSDALARWLIGGRTGAAGVGQAVAEAIPEVDPLLASTLSIVGIAGCLALAACSLARVVIVVVVACIVPAAAALPSRAWRVGLAWVGAVIVVKPVNAVIYRVGRSLITGESDPLLVLIATTSMFVLAAGMLPMMARLLQTAAHP
ncbi:MAG: hypothetical protein MUD05_05460 [Candidatus Nanopelagicales bacterium]|jgi:hypothetical protein|nr:hypothetical protein [Candidatus Nanopelagicales bacterium]